MKARRLLGRLLAGLFGLLGLLLVLLLIAVFSALSWLRGEEGSAFLLAEVLQRVQPHEGSLEVATLRTDLTSNLRLEGVVLKDDAGRELAGLDSIELDYGLGALLRKTLVVHRVQAAGVRAELRQTDEGLDIATIWADPAAPPKPSSPYEGLPITLVLEEIEVQSNTLALSTGEQRLILRQASLYGGLAFRGDDIIVEELALYAGPHRVLLDVALRDLGGVDPSVDLTLRSLLVDADRLPLDLPVAGVFELSGELEGSLESPSTTLELQTPGGPLSLAVSLDLGPERPVWSVDLETTDLALDHFVRDLEPLQLGGRIEAEGEGLTWPHEVDGLARISLHTTISEPIGEATLDSRLALSEGLVLVQELVASTPTGTVDVEGLVDVPAQTASATIHGLVVQLADLGRFGVAGLRGEGQFSGEGEVDWSGDKLAAALKGRLVGRRLGSGSDVSIGRLEGPIAGSWSAEVLDVEGSLRASGIQAGPITADRGRAVLSMHGDRVGATVDVFDEARTVLGLDGSGDLDTKSFVLTRIVLSPAPDQVWEGQGVQRLTLVEGGVRGLRLAIASGSSALRASGSAQMQGPLALEATLVDLSLDTLAPFVPQLAGLSGLANAEVELSGNANSPAISARATVSELTLPGTVSGLHAQLDLQSADDRVAIDLKAGDGEQTLATLVGTLPVRVALDEPGLLPGEPVDLLLTLPKGSTDRWNELLGEIEIPELEGALQARVTGSPLHPDLELEADIRPPPPRRGVEAPSFALKASSKDDELVLDLSMFEDGQSRAHLEGGARVHLHTVAASLLGEGPALDLAAPSTWLSELDLVLRPDLPLHSLDAFVSIPDEVQGKLVGELKVSGSPDAPQISADLRLEEARLGETPVDVATILVEPAPGGTALRAELGFSEAGDLKVDAFLPIELRAGEALRPQLDRPGFRFTVSGGGIPVDVVAALWPGMQDARGQVLIEGELGGALTAPTGLLRASAEGVGFRLIDTGVTYDELRFELRVDERAISLRDFHVLTSMPGRWPKGDKEGTVKGEVEALLDGTKLGEWQGRLEFNRTLVSALPDQFLRVGTGTLLFSGTPPKIKVNGSLKIEDAQLSLDERFFRGPAALEHPTWLTVHRNGDLRPIDEEPTVEEASGLPEWLTVNLALDLNGATFLRARLPLGGTLGGLAGPLTTLQLDSQADGTVTASIQDGELSMTGQVEVTRGDVVLFGKPFEIDGNSTITFTGRDFSDPVLALSASYDTRKYGLVNAEISGQTTAPVVVLSSTEYASQDDVISMLLFDKPASELAAGEGEDGASAAAMSMLLTSLGQALGQQGEQAAAMVLAPDLLVVGNETASIGKRLGRRLFVVVDIDNTANDITRSYLTLTVEYAIGGPWEMEFRHGTAGQDAIELNWTRRR